MGLADLRTCPRRAASRLSIPPGRDVGAFRILGMYSISSRRPSKVRWSTVSSATSGQPNHLGHRRQRVHVLLPRSGESGEQPVRSRPIKTTRSSTASCFR